MKTFFSSVNLNKIASEVMKLIKVVANNDLGRQRKWILTRQHCTCLPHAKSRFSTMSTIPISSYRRAH